MRYIKYGELQDERILLDNKNRRKVSYDEPRKIEILDGGAVRIKCADGFQTIIKPEEWQKIEIERVDR